MTEATQRPWSRDKYGYMIANGKNLYVAHGVTVPSGERHPRNAEALANEELILKAVNAHDALVQALEAVEFMGPWGRCPYSNCNAAIREQHTADCQLAAALEAAK